MDKVNPLAFLKYKANIIGRPADTAAYRVVIDYIEALEAENAALRAELAARGPVLSEGELVFLRNHIEFMEGEATVDVLAVLHKLLERAKQ
jgi:hypothetical protein